MRIAINNHHRDRLEQRTIDKAAADLNDLSLVTYLNILGLYPWTDHKFRLHYGPILPGHSGDLYIVPGENAFHIDHPPCAGSLTDFCRLYWDVTLTTLVYNVARFELHELQYQSRPIA